MKHCACDRNNESEGGRDGGLALKRGALGFWGLKERQRANSGTKSGLFVIKTTVLAKIGNCKTLSFLVFRLVLNKILPP